MTHQQQLSVAVHQPTIVGQYVPVHMYVCMSVQFKHALIRFRAAVKQSRLLIFVTFAFAYIYMIQYAYIHTYILIHMYARLLNCACIAIVTTTSANLIKTTAKNAARVGTHTYMYKNIHPHIHMYIRTHVLSPENVKELIGSIC